MLLPFVLHAQDTAISTVKLSVNSNLKDASVYLDTTNLGKIPVVDYSVLKGSYMLKIINGDTRSWNSENYSKEITLTGDTAIDINFEHYYSINSSPFNAKVYKSGFLLGLTPLRIYFPAPLSESITLKKRNYKDKVISPADFSSSNDINVTLEPQGKVITDNPVFRDRQTNFKSERNFWAIGSFAAGVLASAYTTISFKNTANDAYDRYLENNNQADLNISNKNDVYSTISLVVMQAAMAGLIYFLFIDK